MGLLSKVFEAFANSSESRYVFLFDVEKDVCRFSKSCVDRFDLPGEYVDNAGEVWASIINPADRFRFQKSLQDLIAGNTKIHDMSYRALDRTGEYVVCSCKGFLIEDDDGHPVYFAGTIDNHGIATEYDPITNLYTRYKLLNDLKDFQERKEKYMMLMVGLCNFHEINNIYGYEVGNKVLKNFAEKLLDYLDGAFVFHAGGTKFAIVSAVYTEEKMADVYKELSEYARNSIDIDGSRVAINIGGSLSEVKNFEVDVHTILTGVLLGLDESIHDKHGELVKFGNDNYVNNHDRIVVINTLRNCINDDCKGFYLCFQPIVNANTEKLVGAETLVRWNMEPYGNIPPGEFVAWLENDPLFYDLSNWIMRTSMTMVKEKVLPLKPDFLLNINLSYMQLERQDFRKDLVRIIEDVGYPPQNLCLELTERCKLLDESFLRNEMIFLKSKGIRVALDDFGTGFSALELLITLPIDAIKIDRTFVMDIENIKEKQYVVDAILACAKNMNISSTIEGIETVSMKEIMKNYGATSFQGYLYSKPVEIDEFIKLITT